LPILLYDTLITLKLGVFQLVVFREKDEVYGVRLDHKFPNFSPLDLTICLLDKLEI
jgi:hypothetical protein